MKIKIYNKAINQDARRNNWSPKTYTDVNDLRNMGVKIGEMKK